MTAHGCAGLSSLPLFHALNTFSIASLGQVVAGLNRCGAFRIQQQVLHSDAGNFFPVFPVVPLFFSSRNIGFCIRPGASFHFRAIKLNVSLSVCGALNRHIKIRNFFITPNLLTFSNPSRHRSRGITTDTTEWRLNKSGSSFSAPPFCGVLC